MKSEKEWADFGKHIYDSAMKLFIDKPTIEAVIPFYDEENLLCKVIVKDVPVFVDVIINESGDREFIHYYKMSDGTLKRKL